MKKVLPILFLSLGVSVSAMAADYPSKVYEGELLTAISDNGRWLVGAPEADFSLIIHDLETGKEWLYLWDGNDFGKKYAMGADRCISDDGVLVGEISDAPYYWKDGTWYPLKVMKEGGSSYVGSITPDGSLIVGGLGFTGMTIEDEQMTYPVVWERKADGTYGEPRLLQFPARDIFGLVPQYLQCVSVSTDGKTIGASQTVWSGKFHFPLVFTKSASGEWSYRILGLDLVNPNNLEIPVYPGDYEGPEAPNWELYLTTSERARFEAAFPAWALQQEREGYTDEQVSINMLTYVATFMSGENKSNYEMLINRYLEEFVPWREAYIKYEEFEMALNESGVDFEMNNIRISPDGKYVYATQKRLVIEDPTNPEYGVYEVYAPVRFDSETGQATVIDPDCDMLLSSVSADYSIFVREHLYVPDQGTDPYVYTPGYVFPQGTEPIMTVADYLKEQGKTEAYEWMKENMTKTTAVFYPDGTYEWLDVLGGCFPIATPDMRYILFNATTMYWDPEEPYLFVSYLVNVDEDSGVEEIGSEGEAQRYVRPLGGGVLETAGVTALEVYDLAGAKVYANSAVNGTVATGLQSGVYVVKAVAENGAVINEKLAL